LPRSHHPVKKKITRGGKMMNTIRSRPIRLLHNGSPDRLHPQRDGRPVQTVVI
jgi:hypothetical protein